MLRLFGSRFSYEWLGPTGPRAPCRDLIADAVSFLAGIEWFLIREPGMRPLAYAAAPPPNATNRRHRGDDRRRMLEVLQHQNVPFLSVGLHVRRKPRNREQRGLSGGYVIWTNVRLRHSWRA
jgi:hypothetical protein